MVRPNHSQVQDVDTGFVDPKASMGSASEFIRGMQDFGHLRGFRLQRFISTAIPVKHEIHCFGDASINDYATAVYLVTETAN